MGVSVAVLVGSGADVDVSVDVKDGARVNATVGIEVGVEVDDDPRAPMAKMPPTPKTHPAIKLTILTIIMMSQTGRGFLSTTG